MSYFKLKCAMLGISFCSFITSFAADEIVVNNVSDQTSKALPKAALTEEDNTFNSTTSKTLNDTLPGPKMAIEALYIIADTLRFHPMFDSIASISEPSFVAPSSYRYLAPTIFFGKVSPSNFTVEKKTVERLPLTLDSNIATNLFEQLERDSIMERAYTKAMAQNPESIEYDWATMPEAPKDEVLQTTISNHIFGINKPKFEHATLYSGAPKADRWQHSMKSALQFSQNYVSENWYKGGESNLNILSIQNFKIFRFDESKKTEFETTIDIKTGFYTTSSDTVRQFRVNEDMFQVASKYGIRAFEKWYYTGSMLFKTQIFNSYKANSNELSTQFLSPAELNLSVGLDYKHQNEPKTFTWSVLLAPLAYNLKYVANIKKIDETRFGIDEGKHTLNQVGSSLTNNFEWKMSKNITWTSRLFFFTNYSTSQGDFENTFNFSFNRYFSTRVNLHLRYDDDIDPEDDIFQFKELLSVGFNYIW